MNNLNQLGWTAALDPAWQALGQPDCVPGRVLADFGSAYKVGLPEEVIAEAAGRFQYLADPADLPKVGDWVAVRKSEVGRSTIHAVLPRLSHITRRAPGSKLGKQVLATNIDIAFLVQALDQDFSPERFERYLLQLAGQHIQPVIILNKADKSPDPAASAAELSGLGVPVIVMSAIQGDNIAAVGAAIAPGQTAVFLGSSGVGKSTITNALLGEAKQATQEVRASDSKGRHTTTHRELFILANGGLIIDTPGIRELQLWGAENSLEDTFGDIEDLALRCQFTNCTHLVEPGCAVMAAVSTGTLEQSRLDDYHKLQAELRELAAQVDIQAALDRKRAHRQAAKADEPAPGKPRKPL